MFCLYYLYNTYELGWHKGIGVMLKVFSSLFQEEEDSDNNHTCTPPPTWTCYNGGATCQEDICTVVVPPAKRTFAQW